MNRIAPILLALGLACFFGVFGRDVTADPDAGEIGTATMALLALSLCATFLGGANLVRRWR